MMDLLENMKMKVGIPLIYSETMIPRNDDPGEEFDESELNKYDDLEVINCHNDNESQTPILLLHK